MKKNIFKTFLLGTLALPALMSCEMDQFPTTSIPNESSFEVFQDAANFNVGLYSYARSISVTGWTPSDIMADYFQPGSAYGNRNGMIYGWEYTSTEFEGEWANCYSAIANANNFLNNYETVDSTGHGQEMLQFIGDAYFVRAFAYYQLAVRFCQDYDAATANDPNTGLPIVTNVDINAKPSRSSLQETWDYIKAQADLAAKYVQNDDPSSPTFSKQTVDALRARIALQMDNYTDALNYAKVLIADKNFSLVDDEDEFQDIWTYDTGTEVIYAPAENQDEHHDWGTFYTFNTSKNAYNPDFIPSKATIDMYDEGDYRLTSYFDCVDDVIEGEVTAADVYLFSKYPGNPGLRKSSDNEYTRFNAPKVFRLAEQYLIAAEAAFNLGDAATAESYLNDLRKHRNVATTSGLIGDNLFKEIKLEWKREFIGEGQRIICLKRWNEGFKRDATVQTTATDVVLTSAGSGIDFEADKDNMRFVWEIAQNDLTTNSNLKPNWTIK